MAFVTNFDELKHLHNAAVVGGAKSRAWVDFAITMMDSFPLLYKKAKEMNAKFDEMQAIIESMKTK